MDSEWFEFRSISSAEESGHKPRAEFTLLIGISIVYHVPTVLTKSHSFIPSMLHQRR